MEPTETVAAAPAPIEARIAAWIGERAARNAVGGMAPADALERARADFLVLSSFFGPSMAMEAAPAWHAEADGGRTPRGLRAAGLWLGGDGCGIRPRPAAGAA